MNTRSRTTAAASASAPASAPALALSTGQVMDMPTEQLCPCGGGQSCIVDRRWVGDWVHEDDVFTNAGLPIRKNCFANFTTAQKKLLC
jgi:hypothetical protein